MDRSEVAPVDNTDLVYRTAELLAHVVTHKETNSTALSAVIEVRLETINVEESRARGECGRMMRVF